MKEVIPWVSASSVVINNSPSSLLCRASDHVPLVSNIHRSLRRKTGSLDMPGSLSELRGLLVAAVRSLKRMEHPPHLAGTTPVSGQTIHMGTNPSKFREGEKDRSVHIRAHIRNQLNYWRFLFKFLASSSSF